MAGGGGGGDGEGGGEGGREGGRKYEITVEETAFGIINQGDACRFLNAIAWRWWCLLEEEIQRECVCV